MADSMFNRIRWCKAFLNAHGVTPRMYQASTQDGSLLDTDDILEEYNLVINPGNDFFFSLAKKLRLLWPEGMKEGKYPWRDSAKNIAIRLRKIWKQRDLGKYTEEDVLTCARNYLAQFEENTKYMRILDYFIFKGDKSLLADMLEGNVQTDNSANWAAILATTDSTGSDLI